MPLPFLHESPTREGRVGIEPLRLRIVGTSRHGQILDITAARCSVGSSATCTLRLRAAGVRPLHCVILRSTDGHHVRSCSAHTTLNGRRFREQSLRPGDRLGIGPIQLEVVGTERSRPSRPAAAFSAAPAPSAGDATSAADIPEPHDFLERIERLERQLEAAQLSPAPLAGIGVHSAETPAGPVGWDRAGSVLAALTADPAERERLEAERLRLETRSQELEAALAAKTAEWSATQQRFEERIREWEALHSRAQAEMQELREELARHQSGSAAVAEELRRDFSRLNEELQTERENLASARQSWNRERERLEQEAQAVQARCAELEQLLTTDRDALDRERQRWEAERTALQAELASHQERCRQLERDTLRLQEECEQLTACLERMEFQAEPTASEDVDLQPHAEHFVDEEPVRPATNDAVVPEQAPHAAAPSEQQGSSRGRQRMELQWLAQQWAVTNQPADPASSEESPRCAEPFGHEPAPSPVEVAASEPCEHVSEAAEQLPATCDLEVSDDDGVQPLSDLRQSTVAPREDTCVPEQPTSFLAPESDMAEGEDEDVFDRLRRAGIWRQAADLPSAFDEPEAEADSDIVDPAGNPPYLSPLSRLMPSAFESESAEETCESTDTPEPEAAGDVRAASGHADPAEKWGEEVESAGMAPHASTDPQVPEADEPGASSNSLRSHLGGPGEDDSIEAYMERLLDRVRGGTTLPSSLPVAPAAPAERAPISEIELKVEKPRSGESTPPLAMEEYVPRSQAPELNVNLAAMREIANTTRRDQLLHHARRTSSNKSKAKLLGSVACAAVATASIFYLDSLPHIAIPALCISATLGFVGIIQALAVRRKVFNALRLDTDELHGRAGEEGDPQPAAEEAAGS